jgi:hypothetical protein
MCARVLDDVTGHKADLVPSVRSECYFPDDYRGSWLLFETDRQEEVTVEAGQVIFSQLGKFICKSKHWKKDQYKTLSVHLNGWLAICFVSFVSLE